MEDILLKLADALKNSDFSLYNFVDDGRVNSSLNEKVVIGEISKLKRNSNMLDDYDLIVPKSRYWYDFALKQGEKLIPVNVKLSDLKTADNAGSKEGLYYAFTGKTDFTKIRSWKNFLNEIFDDKKETEADYYYFVVNKQELKDIFVTSVKHLNEIKINKNNLPFQCNWNNNRVMKDKDFETAFNDAVKPIVKSYAQIARDYEEIKVRYGDMCEEIDYEIALENQKNNWNNFVIEKTLEDKNNTLVSEKLSLLKEKQKEKDLATIDSYEEKYYINSNEFER